MSTSYGYLCVTDGSTSPYVSRWDEVAIDLASVRTQLVEVMKADRHGYFEFNIMGYDGDYSISEWLMEHAHHALALRDEYGRLEELDGIVEST